MQKALKLFFAAMLVFFLAACNKPAEDTATEPEKDDEPATEEATEEIVPEEGASLILWDNADAEAEWANTVAQEFTAKYNIPVEVQNVNHVDATGKLETDGPAGLGADVFHAPHDHVGKLVSAGLIYENMFADEYKENFMQAAIDGTSYTTDGESKLYGYPIAIETYALYYNKDLVSKPAETFEELFAQSKEFMADSTNENKKFGLMLEPGNFYYAHAFLGGYGGYIFGDNNTNPADLGINNEGAIESGKFMQKLHDELLPLKVEDITGDIISSFFNEGKLLYRISGPWDLANHKAAGVNFGVAPLPKLDNGQAPASFSGIKAYYVNSYSKYPKAATLLAKFASSPEMLEKRFEITGQVPPHKALLESDALKADEYAMAFLEQAQNAIPMPNITEMQSVWGPMGVAYTTIWNDKTDPKAAFDAARAQIEDAIATQSK
jgi:arabinogalactan oligomer / maltooligosaccharide transport system substrate-binding protein